MSFLIDPPLLVASGIAIEMAAPTPNAADTAEGTVLAVFLGTSISLYMEAKWTKPIWKLCRARSGRDWMVNSGVFHADCAEPSSKMNAAAALAFATYPAWLRLGRRIGRRLSSRTGG